MPLSLRYEVAIATTDSEVAMAQCNPEFYLNGTQWKIVMKDTQKDRTLNCFEKDSTGVLSVSYCDIIILVFKRVPCEW